MMGYTDRHFRYLLRGICQQSLLFTEMITTGAINYGDHKRLLYDACEHPLAVQIGGSDPVEILKACKIISGYAYDEINLNVGCPSNAVQNGNFGAKLMLEPDTVAKAIVLVKQHISIPFTIKCRIGVDDHDSYEFLHNFIKIIANAGVNVVYVHARKALLKGLSPKQNRTIPALKYDVVYRLKQDFPDLEIYLNGGINSLSSQEVKHELVDGIMLGREVYRNPLVLARVPFAKLASIRIASALRYLEYVAENTQQKVAHLTKHMQGLWYKQPMAAEFRYLTTCQDASLTKIQDFVLQYQRTVAIELAKQAGQS